MAAKSKAGQFLEQFTWADIIAVGILALIALFAARTLKKGGQQLVTKVQRAKTPKEPVAEEFEQEQVDGLAQRVYEQFCADWSTTSNFFDWGETERDAVIMDMYALQDAELALLYNVYNTRYQNECGPLDKAIEDNISFWTAGYPERARDVIQRIRQATK
jgi:hypothetical protein